MRVAVFLVCLCFLVLRGYNCIYTGAHYNNLNCTEIRSVQKALLAKNNQEDTVIQKDTVSDNGEECLVDDDVEDGEPNNLFARKYRLLVNGDLVPSHLFILHYLHTCSKTSLAFYGLLSCKYITQNVLRI